MNRFATFLKKNWAWWLLPIVLVLGAVAALNYFFPIVLEWPG